MVTRTVEQQAFNRSIPGWFDDDDISTLESLSNSIENGILVEVGSMHGRSAYCLGTSSPSSTVYCFDYCPGSDWILVKSSDGSSRLNSIEIFQHYTSECKNIIPIKLPYLACPKWDNGLVDLVFVDAMHTNPSDWENIEFWLPKIKTGGILCGHDYYTKERNGFVHYPDVVANVRRLESMLNIPVTLSDRSSVWSFKIA